MPDTTDGATTTDPTTDDEAATPARPRSRRPVRHRAVTVVLAVAVAVLGAAQLSSALPGDGGGEALPSTPRGSTFVPLSPVRVLDTRKTTGNHQAKFTAGETFSLKVTGGAVPADASAVDINLTVTGASATSHLRVFPAGGTLPTASAINFDAGETIANEYHVKVGIDGKVNIFNNSGQADVIVDVVGYYRTATLADVTATTFTRTFNLSGLTIASGACKSAGIVNDNPALAQGDLVMIRATDPLADDVVIPTQTVSTFFGLAGGQTPGNAVVVMICNPGATNATFSGSEVFEFRVIR